MEETQFADIATAILKLAGQGLQADRTGAINPIMLARG